MNHKKLSESKLTHSPSYIALLKVVFSRQTSLLKRYWINTVSGLVINYILFAFIFFGGKIVAPTIIEGNLSAIIVGFFVWTMSWGAFQVPASNITKEAKLGTLEQISMSPFGLTRILLMRIVVRLFFTLITGGLMLVSMMITAMEWIQVDIVTVIPLSLITLGSVAGLGFAMGGIALVYKRIGSLIQIMQFLFLALISAPERPFIELLPLVLGSKLLRRAMNEGTRIWQFELATLGVLLSTTVLYIMFGVFVLQYFIDVAKSRGLMGDY